MVILSGYLKNKKIVFSGSVKRYVRPTKTLVKKVLFDIISSIIFGSICLDLFCGTASLGLEAVSRGAKYVYFVDKNKFLLKSFSKFSCLNNLLNVTFINSYCLNFVLNCYITFDIIFIDAPYSYFFIIENLLSYCRLILNPGGYIYFENYKSNFKIEKTFVGFEVSKVGFNGNIVFYLLKLK